MRRKAFTLIELLVVIAIIAILAAILFPVFAQAKAAAKASADLSNVKQLTLGIEMFKADHDGHYPKAWFNDEIGGQQTGTPNPFWGWDFAIQPYVKSRDLFRSPLDSRSFPRGLWSNAGTPLVQQPGNVNLGPMGARHIEDDIPASYRYNISNMDHQFTALNESALEFSSEAIVIAPSVPGPFDANWHQISTSVDAAFVGDDWPRSGVCINKTDVLDYDRNSPVSRNPTPAQRRQGRANYGFADGHAKSYAFGATWRRVGAADVTVEGVQVTPTMWRQRFASPTWWREVCAYREGEAPR